MAYSEAAYAYANAELEKRKQAAAMRTMEMREKIRSTVPGFTSTERERMSLGMLRMRAKLSGDTAEADRLAEGLEEIRKRIDGMLSAYGFTRADLEDIHFCSRCSDTGVLPDGSVCECKESLMAKYDREQINSVSPLAMCTFDTFSLSKYSDVDSKEYGVSARDNMRSILRCCREYAESFPCRRNLLLMGSAGLGKTHLALSIADQLIRKKVDVVYCSCSSIFDNFK